METLLLQIKLVMYARVRRVGSTCDQSGNQLTPDGVGELPSWRVE